MRRDWKGKTVLKHVVRRYMSTHTYKQVKLKINLPICPL